MTQGLPPRWQEKWQNWKTGKIDLFRVQGELERAIPAMVGGAVIALLAGIAALVVATRRARRVPIVLC